MIISKVELDHYLVSFRLIETLHFEELSRKIFFDIISEGIDQEHVTVKHNSVSGLGNNLRNFVGEIDLLQVKVG